MVMRGGGASPGRNDLVAVLTALIFPLMIACGTLTLWWEEGHQDARRQSARLDLEAEVVRAGVAHRLHEMVQFLTAGVYLWQNDAIATEDRWRRFSSGFLSPNRELVPLSAVAVAVPDSTGRAILRFASTVSLTAWLQRPALQALAARVRDAGGWRLSPLPAPEEGEVSGERGLVVVVMPVYGQTSPPVTLEARRRELTGWVVGVIDLGALVAVVVQERGALHGKAILENRVVWQDRDWDTVSRHASGSVGAGSVGAGTDVAAVRIVPLAGTALELRFRPAAGLENEMADQDPELILGGGLSLAVLLALAILQYRWRWGRAEAGDVSRHRGEERFHNLFLHNEAVALLVSPDEGIIVDANLAASRYYGYDVDRLRGMPLRDIAVLSQNAPANGPAALLPHSFRHRLASGEVRDVEVQSGPVDMGGNILLYSVVHDISERRKAEQNLVRTARILETLNAASEAIARPSGATQLLQDICRILVDVGRFRLVWAGGAQDTEDQRVVPLAQWGEAVAYLDRIKVSWGDNPWGQGPVGRAISENRPVAMALYDDPHCLLWQEQARLFGLVSAVGLPVPMDNRPAYCLALYSGEQDAFDPETVRLLARLAETLAYGLQARRDAERRRTAEQALRASEARFRAVFDRAGFGIAVTDIDAGGRLVLFNPACCRMLGRTPADLAGRTWADITHPDDIQPNLVLANRFRRGEIDAYALEKRYLTPEGRAIWCSVQVTRMGEGGDGLAVAMLEDISERRRVESELLRSNADLEQFAYAVSHDLQEPLRMISSYLQLLDRRLQGQLDADCIEYVQFATGGARRMRNMIRALLDYSRVHSRGLDFLPVSLTDCCREALDNLESARQEAGPETEISVPPLPTVAADSSQIMRLFQNLLGNALKYRVSDRPVRITVDLAREAGFWRITVRDNGIGIDPGQDSRLFQVFQRLHRDTEYEGTGVGLALCRRIVERHGGSIGVNAVPGQGSAFWFTLPVMPERAA